MFHELELRLIQRDVAADVTAACGEIMPDRRFDVDTYDFDATVTVSGDVDVTTAWRIARRLRGGRDFDASRPADWHVRSVSRERDGEVTGCPKGPATCISLCQTFQAPAGYTEDHPAR